MTVAIDTHALLEAVDATLGETAESRVQHALERAFAGEGIVSTPHAVAIARRFCAAVPLRDRGLSNELIATELDCSTKTIARDLEHIARLAAGSALLQKSLLGGRG